MSIYKKDIEKILKEIGSNADPGEIEDVMRIVHNGVLDSLMPQEFRNAVKLATQILKSYPKKK